MHQEDRQAPREESYQNSLSTSKRESHSQGTAEKDARRECQASQEFQRKTLKHLRQTLTLTQALTLSRLV